MRILSTLLLMLMVTMGFAQDVDITFRVNMATVPTSPDGPFLAGGGTFGNPGDNAMTETAPGSDIYEITVTLPQGTSSYYTFTNGNCPDYSCKENIAGLPCADPANFNDRFFPAVQNDTTILACFNQCTTDGSCGTVSTGDVTFQVDMSNYTGSFASVAVGGTWNGFDPNTSLVLTEVAPGADIYVGTLTLDDGVYEYKFIADPLGPDQFYENLVAGSPCTVSNFGFTNRSLTVAGDVQQPLVCFESCLTCDAPTVDITWKVNMSAQPTDPGGVFLAGGGNFGVPGDFPLVDDGTGGDDVAGDDIWTITVTRPVGFTSFYKFANGACPDFACAENLAGQSCGDPANFNDRNLPAVQNDTTILVCYAQCTTDGSCGVLPQAGDVTFQVDMNEYDGPEILGPNSVYLFGTFNGFNPSELAMDDSDGDGVYTITVNVPGGQHEYLYTLNQGAETESFAPGEPCTITNGAFTNRLLSVDGDETLPVVCYESCDACGAEVCTLADTAPVDLTKSQQPVPFPNGVIDRAQVKWYKASPQVKYSADDNTAVDIQFWPIRDLELNIPIVNGDTSLIAKKTKPNKDLFKWPIKYDRADIDPLTRYAWRVRIYCDAGDGPVSPWSDVKIVNTPDFDPETGIYTPPGGFFHEDGEWKSLDTELAFSFFPNPSDGTSLTLMLDKKEEADVAINVLNINGASVYNYSGVVKGTEMKLDFAEQLPAGMYFIQIESNGTLSNDKFIVR